MIAGTGVPIGDGEKRRSLGKYHLIASLGQGGMAKVYLGLVTGPAGVNKLMVIKVLESDMLAGPEGGLELFWDEARLAARLDHPNIVHTYEVGEIDGQYFLAMEHLDGQTYRSVRARSITTNRLPVCEDLRILSELARGLYYAHELKGYAGEPLGVVHRDVSPQNVFISYDGQVKLIDFGIAKTHDAGHETRVGVIKGKLNYIAPEQLRGDPLDGRADVFALGVMLWEALTGRSFSGGPRVADVTKVHARIKGEEPNVRAVRPDVAEELAIIVDKALMLDREQRWKDAASFADALDAYLEWAGERPSAKNLSAWMHDTFSEDRTALRALIDEQVRALSSPTSVTRDELPHLKLRDEPHTFSGVWPGSANSSLVMGTTPPSTPSPVGTTHAGFFLSRRQLGLIVAGGAASIAAAALAIAMLSPAVATRPGAALSVAAPSGPALAPSAATPSAAAPGSAALAEPTASVMLRLHVSPPNAQVRLDGVSIEVPFLGEFPRSATLHRVEASAPGYAPFSRHVALDQDRSLDIGLVRSDPQRVNRASLFRARNAPERQAPERQPPERQPLEHVTESHLTKPAASAEPALNPGTNIQPSKAKLHQIEIYTADPYSTVK